MGARSPSAARGAGIRASLLFAVLAVAVASIGALDVATGPDLGMSLFYLVPVSVGSWQLGRWPGLALAGLAAGAWLTSDLLTARNEVSYWNGFTRLVIFSTVAVLLANLRTERLALRQTVQRLNDEHARMQSLIAGLTDAILIVDEDGRIASVNEHAAVLLGRSGLVGRPAEEVVPFLATAPRRDGRWIGTVTSPFGAPVEVEVSRASIGDPTATRAAVYVLHDITQHAELNRMREQLLYNVAHELRGPLGVLENALDIIATDYADLSAEEHARMTGSALRTAQRLRTLMEDLLSAGSIQSGRFTVVPEPLRVRDMVEDALEAVRPQLEERDQRVEMGIAEGGPLVRADRRYARQVLTNLLSNASKYAPHATAISVTAEQQGGEVRVAVTDRGPGIPADQLAGLFERYYRMRRDAAEPGIGLGLAIAKGIVEAHGGRIGIDSAIGKGTTVWFTMPAAREVVAA
jgi:two-component system, OmpR family, phosphate regulon sensor histidine kinase PhoR